MLWLINWSVHRKWTRLSGNGFTLEVVVSSKTVESHSNQPCGVRPAERSGDGALAELAKRLETCKHQHPPKKPKRSRAPLAPAVHNLRQDLGSLWTPDSICD